MGWKGWLLVCWILSALSLFPCARAETVAVSSDPSGRSPQAESSVDFSRTHPVEFQKLYRKVQRHYSMPELKALLSRKDAVELDDFHRKRIEAIASPHSVRVQRQEHIDWVPKLVNPETLARGGRFFEEYRETFRMAYEKTGVDPRDILAVLNWESKLGEYRGEYDVFRIFVGQIFTIDEVERSLYLRGAYSEPGAMDRPRALERIGRIKDRAVNNLGELLIQSKVRGFDPCSVKGSWAGAIGIPQFMPASMSYAADGDGDGVIDLNTVEDAILSVATYLAGNGYHSRGAQYSLKRYNPEEAYVRGVSLYSDHVVDYGVRVPPDWVYRGKN